MNIFLAIDFYLSDLILNLPHNFILNSFFGFFAVKGVFLIIWLLIFGYLVFFEEKKDKRFIFYFIMSLLISALIFTLMKNLIKRPRPVSKVRSQLTPTDFNRLRLILTDYPTSYSFPSGHTTISFSVAAILAFFDKKRKKYFYLIAVIIAFSRVYLGYHYLYDVLAGAFLGWLISSAVLKINIINLYET
ncbi:MAG: hypothetical protein ACD_12C00038G0004 [uncultured bacterium]|nr:MAG: hypothetical protein ACD_12C00038G0004 [uncultured bacterium]